MDLLASFCSSVLAAANLVGRWPPGRLMLALRTARGGGHNLLQPLYVASGTKKGGDNNLPRASNYPLREKNDPFVGYCGITPKGNCLGGMSDEPIRCLLVRTPPLKPHAPPIPSVG